MTEATQAVEETNEVVAPVEAVDELAVLKQRATLMGVKFSNNISVEKLREKIEAKLSDEEIETVADEADDKPKSMADIRAELLASQMRLVRLRITNLDPKKKDLPGEIFTVANEYIGTVRKFVPYGEVTDDGYHVPYCIYTMLEEKRFLNIRTIKDRRTGTNRIEQKWAKEFALEVLPALTPAELERLAQAQIAAGSVDTNATDEYLA